MNHASLWISTRKTMFLLALDWGLALDPSLESGRLTWRCVAGHWIPAVFLSCEIHTTRPILSHCGHFLWSPTVIMFLFPPSSWCPRTTSFQISFCTRNWFVRTICIFYNFLLTPLLTYTMIFTSCLFYFEKVQLFDRFA